MTPATDIDDYLHAEVGAILDACTRCGACAEVCPVVPFSEARTVGSVALVEGVTRSLRDDTPMPAPSAAWVHGCNGCGDCIPACPEGVNPRKMLLHATIKESARSSATPQLFRRMARSIKLMAAMQIVPAEYARLLATPRQREADIVFYTGCNAVRTPHLLFNVMYVLDALGADYEVLGGPSSCCGVIATKWEGEARVGGRFTTNTLTRFNSFQPAKVLNWCPTCAVHLDETMGGFAERRFDFDHVTDWLLARSDDLQKLFTTPVRKRVVLHAHRGLPEVGRNVEALLRCIPGLELVETVLESSYTCGGSGCNKTPALRDIEHDHLIERVHAHNADALVTLYHGCHMSFVHHEKDGHFEVLNFTDLLAQAAGMKPHVDQFKNYRLHEEWQAIVDEARPYLEHNGVDIDGDWLQKHGPEIFSVAEFRGGLDCLSTEPPRRQVPSNES